MLLFFFTGPMFIKYNAVLREAGVRSNTNVATGAGATISQQNQSQSPGQGGTAPYCTTIHLIASGLVKLGRLQPALTLYRGLKDLKIPEK